MGRGREWGGKGTLLTRVNCPVIDIVTPFHTKRCYISSPFSDQQVALITHFYKVIIDPLVFSLKMKRLTTKSSKKLSFSKKHTSNFQTTSYNDTKGNLQQSNEHYLLHFTYTISYFAYHTFSKKNPTWAFLGK